MDKAEIEKANRLIKERYEAIQMNNAGWEFVDWTPNKFYLIAPDGMFILDDILKNPLCHEATEIPFSLLREGRRFSYLHENYLLGDNLK